MVIRLTPPDVDGIDLVEKIVAERQAGKNVDFFNEIEDGWKERVRSYVESKGNPELVKPWPKVQSHQVKFQNLYLNPLEQSVQKPILQALRSRIMQLCPACGEDGTPNTLDHYLPKNGYPEFAITPLNLSPMCDICQGKKGAKILNAANQRMFLHPYFDEFTDAQVFMLEIGKPFNAPAIFSIRAHVSLSDTQASLVSRHIHELGISKRYDHFFREQYLRLLRLVNNMRMKGLNVRQSLELFRDNALDKSVNSWLHVFYSGVLADEDLIAYLETAQLPDCL